MLVSSPTQIAPPMDDYFANVAAKPWRHHELLTLKCATPEIFVSSSIYRRFRVAFRSAECTTKRTSLVRVMSKCAPSSSSSSLIAGVVRRRNQCRMPAVLSRVRDCCPRDRPRSSALYKGKEECPSQFYRRTTDSLSGTRDTDGAEWRRWRRWYGADINPLLMKYHKSGDKIYYGRIEKASTN